MNWRLFAPAVLVSLLAGCGQEPPASGPQKSFGGQLGDSYKGMLDETRQGVEGINEQMQHIEQTVRERDR